MIKFNMEQAMEIINSPIDQLYKLVRLYKLQDKEYQGTYNKVRNGINIKFDINKYFQDLYTIKDKSEEILINNKVYSLKDFWSEIEIREDLMRNLILGNAQQTGKFSSR